MARKKTSNEPKKELELAVSAEEARSRLEERVAKGNEIKEIQINSPDELDVAKKNYYKWNDFNEELLKRLFTTEEFSEEYSYWGGVGVISLGERPLDKKIHDFHDDVNDKLHRLDSIIERLELIPLSASVSTSEPKRTEKSFDKSKVFIVHGHDNEVKQEVARFIEKIGFEPIILHEQASGSKTIIEKIEAYSDVGFGVVLYTPCDVGAKASRSPSLSGRARQNVVFEHGFLIGKLGRKNVCSLVKGDVEKPNDIAGIVYTPMDSGEWKIELAKELRTAGYHVDMNKVI